MAFPFKTGGDFYNCEAQRMRLHNLGANPTETATGLMYFNTGASNLGKHAVVHDGTNFKALAFVDEIATNAEFVELKEKVDLLIGDDVDTDTIIDSWKEVQAFLADIEDTKTLQGMLNSYLPLSGGDITGETTITGRFKLLRGSILEFVKTDGNSVLLRGNPSSNELQFHNGTTWNDVLHTGNIGSQSVNNATKFNNKELQRFVYDELGSSTTGTTDTGSVSYTSLTRTQFFKDNAISAIGFIAYHSSANSYGVALYNKSYTSEALTFRVKNNGSWLDEKTIAFTDSTVAAAEKLATARTIWGQEFDGTGNIENANVTLFKNPSGGTTSWARCVRALSSTNSALGQIGFYGTGETLNYAYIGTAHNEPWLLVNPSGNVTIGDRDLAENNCKLYVDGGIRVYGTTMVFDTTKENRLTITHENGIARIYNTGKNTSVYFGNYQGNALNIVNENILIGTTTDSGAKLQVNGAGYFNQYNASGNKSGASIIINKSGDWFGIGAASNVNHIALGYVNTSGGWKSEVMTFKGDNVHIKGNLIVDGEVSAGGAGQEGESGDGGAEVISQPLAKGQSTYTITNTIKRSDIAVSLYEWNANNESWDMCLADISVKDATITVTFGSATSVNHKLVAVG